MPGRLITSLDSWVPGRREPTGGPRLGARVQPESHNAARKVSHGGVPAGLWDWTPGIAVLPGRLRAPLTGYWKCSSGSFVQDSRIPGTLAGLPVPQLAARTHEHFLVRVPGPCGIAPHLPTPMPPTMENSPQQRADHAAWGFGRSGSGLAPGIFSILFSLKPQAACSSLTGSSKQGGGRLPAAGEGRWEVVPSAASPPLKMKFSDLETRSWKILLL